MTPTTTSSPRRADAVRNRGLILAAAQEACADKGIAVSIDEIVCRAGVAKGTFFRHFPTKEALVEALLVDRFVRLGAIAREVNATCEPGWCALRTVLERFVSLAAADCSFSESLGCQGPAESADVRQARQALRDEMTEILTAAQACGEVRPDVASSDLPMILMGIVSATAPMHAAEPGLGVRYLRLFLDGLRATAPSDLVIPALDEDDVPTQLGGSRRP